MNAEVKYRRIPVRFGQYVTETPEYQFWKGQGWEIKWKYLRVQGGRQVVETLLFRQPETAAPTA